MATITADDINGLLNKASAMLGFLKKRLVPTSSDDAQLAQLQTEIGVAAGQTLVSADTWQKKADDEQSAAYAKLRSFVRQLRRQEWAELAPGVIVFVLLAVLLCGLAAFYHSLHGTSQGSARISDSQILEVLHDREAIQAGLADLAAKDAERTAASDPKVQKALADQVEALFVRIAKRTDALKEAMLRNGLSGSLSSGTLAAFSQVVAQLEARQVTARASFESLRKSLDPEIESLRTRYLWTEVPRRWFEIAWWAEFGTLVGLLFYIAGCLELGTFKTEELSMFATELIITPLVVTVVFFLFGLTGITGFAPSESNIAETVGIAFILGFAIRRTVGLLDILKKRIFPDPSPAAQANG